MLRIPAWRGGTPVGCGAGPAHRFADHGGPARRLLPEREAAGQASDGPADHFAGDRAVEGACVVGDG